MVWGLEPSGMLYEMQEITQYQGMERSWGIKEKLQDSKGVFVQGWRCPVGDLMSG